MLKYHLNELRLQRVKITVGLVVLKSLAFLRGVVWFALRGMFRARPVAMNAHVVITTELADP
jgi:hypothetical protein